MGNNTETFLNISAIGIGVGIKYFSRIYVEFPNDSDTGADAATMRKR